MSNISYDKQICYTTLAIGYEYNNHALQLAKDIQIFSPNTSFIVLTDRPRLYYNIKNVIPILHRVQSVGIYHDKLFCIEECFKHFKYCIFLDADCRLMKDVTVSRNWKPGITAKFCWNFKNFLIKPKGNVKQAKRLKLLTEVTKEYQIMFEECYTIPESFMVFCKDNGKEEEFLKTWKRIRDFFEINEIFDGEGAVIGIAAYKSGLNIYHYNLGYQEEEAKHKIQYFYKDKLLSNFFKKKNETEISKPDQVKLLELDKQRKELNSSVVDKIRVEISNFFTKLAKKKRLIYLRTKYVGKKIFSEFTKD